MLARRRSIVAILSLTCAALAIAGCGSSSSSSTSTTSSSAATTSGSASASSQGTGAARAEANVVKLVPAAIKSKGTLTVASDASYAPNEFIASDGKTVIGMDADLAKALGSVMGLGVNLVNAPFDTIIPGLAAGKYDFAASSFTDTKAREKTVDFVTYFIAGTSFYTKASGGVSVTGLSGLCGHTVAVEKGTTQQSDAEKQAAACARAGKSLRVLVFPDQNGANLALQSGRAQIVMADSPVAAYAVKQSGGQFKLVGPTYGTAPYGIAVPKNTGMTRPLLAALEALMKNGAYHAILVKWGEQNGALSHPTINGATS